MTTHTYIYINCYSSYSDINI